MWQGYQSIFWLFLIMYNKLHGLFRKQNRNFFLRVLEVGKFKIKEFVGLMFVEFTFSHLKVWLLALWCKSTNPLQGGAALFTSCPHECPTSIHFVTLLQSVQGAYLHVLMSRFCQLPRFSVTKAWQSIGNNPPGHLEMRTYILGQILHILATRRQGQAFGNMDPCLRPQELGEHFAVRAQQKKT